jgi:N6-L-threonylcarbamoyladenine synthase
MLVLGFESSCDDTCAAVVKCEKNRIICMSNIISSQVDIHKLYGGVVPEIASRNHAMAILGCAQTALNGAGVKMGDISRICATTEPGLRGAVMVGQIFGESLANATQKPFEKINHLCAHIASVFINTDTDFAPPFLALVASGGHTALYHVRAWDDINLVTQTVDDAVGEAFDKVAKILGLPYPGGEGYPRFGGRVRGRIYNICEKSATQGLHI